MSRALLKTAAATALEAVGGTELLRRRAQRRHETTILYHHRVVPDPDRLRGSIPAMAISSASFEWTLDQLAGRYRFVSLDDLDHGHLAGKPSLAITFDDGYRDFYDHAFPILARKGIPAAVFVITDLVGTKVAPMHDRFHAALSAWWRGRRDPDSELAALCSREGIAGAPEIRPTRSGGLYAVFRSLLTGLDRLRLERLLNALVEGVGEPPLESEDFRLMRWDMLAEVQDAGITVGSHTRTHALLPNESPDRVRDEVEGSFRTIEHRLGPGPRHFSYPDGRFDAASVRAVAAAGYRNAFTTCRCAAEGSAAMAVPRRHLWEGEVYDVFGRRSPALVAARVAGAFDRTARCELAHSAPPLPPMARGPGRPEAISR